jgi:hypothetical protein
MIGPNYPAGEYSVKLYKGSQVFDTKIRLLFDPASRHSVKDQETRQNTLMQAYNMMETLAWLDRQAISVRDTAKVRSVGAAKALARELHAAEILMDSLHLKMVVVKEGKVIADERLREKIGFIYGSVLNYKGKPTDSQISGLASLSTEMDKVIAGLTAFKGKQLPEINKTLLKAGKREITMISREEFLKEK